jgi:hypothetical protein
VVECDPLVPHRVPDPVGGGFDVAPALVDQDHVEIAERAELAPSVAAHGHESEAPGVTAGGVLEQAGQPLVGGLGIGPAEGVAAEVGALDERLSAGAQGHGGTVPLVGPGVAHIRAFRHADHAVPPAAITLAVWPKRTTRDSVSSTVC